MPKNRIPDEDICTICRKPRSMHNGDVVHQFRGTGDGKSLVARADESRDASRDGAQGSQGLPAARSSDAILRFVLIEKGIVTVEDLDTAEAKLRATGVIVHDPFTVRDSGSSDAGDR